MDDGATNGTAELRRCTRCRNLIDPEDLFCAECGTEAPLLQQEKRALSVAPDWEVFSFGCRSCGASMSFDARKGALHCPFCGATEVEQRPAGEGVVYPEKMIPFAIGRDDAEKRFHTWLGKGFWRPGDLKKRAAVEGMKALFLPCWNFSGHTDTCWAADVGASTRSGWHPASGELRELMHGVLVPASKGLAEAELFEVANYRFEGLIPTEHTYLQGAAVESFGVTRKGARERARGAFERAVAARVGQQLGGRKMRKLHCNVLIADMLSEPILLPLWIFAYRYKGAPYRFVMNGQTGKSTGKAPFSFTKLLVVIGLVTGLIGALVALVMCLGAIGAAMN